MKTCVNCEYRGMPFHGNRCSACINHSNWKPMVFYAKTAPPEEAVLVNLPVNLYTMLVEKAAKYDAMMEAAK